MANIVEIILKGVDKTGAAFKESTKSAEKLKDILTGIGAAGVGIAAVGATMKKAFDLGREGAVIEQTSESFGFLMKQVDAAPDLMDQLTAASHGTISAFELQSSTMTLLAGAGDELATQLANSTPRLLEIAKAANKLNPALGTTAFMYESIATGVKRAQPLILDNLGLTLKVGEANEKYALSIGKTVEEMSAQDKAMAILNATLEAGDTLIAQVGGTTDSATDSFDQLDVAMSELADTLKKRAAPFLKKAADAILLLMNRSKKLNEILGIHEEEVRATSDGYEPYVEEIKRAYEAAGQLALTQEEANRMMELSPQAAFAASNAFIIMGEVLFTTSRATEEATFSSDMHREALEGLVPAIEEAGEEVDNFAEILIENETAADKARIANKKFLDGIDRDLASPMDAFVKDLEWFLATGGRFEAAWLRIQELAKTAPEEAISMTEELLLAYVDAQEELDMISGDEAAESIRQTLGVELEDAHAMIAGTDGLQEAMAGLGDILIDLSELERMEAITLRILDNLNLFRTAGIGIGVAGEGGVGGGGGTATPAPGPSPVSGTPTGGAQQFAAGRTQVFNFHPSSELDSEEMLERVAQIVSEN